MLRKVYNKEIYSQFDPSYQNFTMKIVYIFGPNAAWKLSKYRVFSGPSFYVYSPNTGKYGPEEATYFDTFQKNV